MAHGKLGRLAPKPHPKTLRLEKFLLAADLPVPPMKIWREYKVPEEQWGMYDNDKVGNCTCAAKAHILMMMTAHTGKMFTPDPRDVMDMYSAITGYDASKTDANGNNPTDNGAAMTDVYSYVQKTGLAGHKILGWAAFDFQNIERVMQAMYIFGAVDVGMNVPQSALDQNDAGETWDVVDDDGGNQGGHDVPYFGGGRRGKSCVTWGANQKSTDAFDLKYWEEGYVLLTEDWLNEADGLAPNMMNLDALTAALKTVAA